MNKSFFLQSSYAVTLLLLLDSSQRLLELAELFSISLFLATFPSPSVCISFKSTVILPPAPLLCRTCSSILPIHPLLTLGMTKTVSHLFQLTYIHFMNILDSFCLWNRRYWIKSLWLSITLMNNNYYVGL